MATIGKIRKRSGLLVIVIGVALALFVLSDFWGNNKRQSQEPLAEIYGDPIPYRDFEARVDKQVDLFLQQYGEGSLTGAQRFEIYNQVYDEMIRNIILNREYEELGLAVSEEEINDMLYGRNIHPYIRQAFTDPQTGVFNPASVTQFIANLQNPNLDDATRTQWQNLLEAIQAERKVSKYQNLITSSFYLPKAFAERDFKAKNRKAVVQYCALRFATISDSSITVTDEELMQYYEAHKHEYEQEASRDLEFVVFDIKPSKTDYAIADSIINQTYTDFLKLENPEDLEIFVLDNSDADYIWDTTTWMVRSQVLPQADTVFGMKTGEIFGPYMDNDVYYIHKIMDKKMMPDSIEAAHILIPFQGARGAAAEETRTKEQAKALADSLLKVTQSIKDSAAFAELAKQYSGDPTAQQNGGFMGMFPEGAMVQPFNEACINNSIGSKSVVETEFGYHIVYVIAKSAPVLQIRMATIRQSVEPSEETVQAIFLEASTFAGENKDQASFDKTCIDKGYNKRLAEFVKPTEYTIAGIEEGREIIRWAFNEETLKGNVSDVFDYSAEDKNVVVIVKEIRVKGIAPFEQVKQFIEPFAKKDKKAQMLMGKVNSAIAGTTDIGTIAGRLKVEVDTADFISFSTFSLPAYGPEPEVVGCIFSMTKGQLSKPIIGQAGIFIVKVVDFIEPPTMDLKETYIQQKTFFQTRVSYEVFKALEKNAEIIDNRLLYF